MDLYKALGALAALTAVLTGLIKIRSWWRQRSLSGRQKNASQRVFQLTRLVSSKRRISEALGTQVDESVFAKAQRELHQALAELSHVLDRRAELVHPPEISLFRRWFLIFLPTRTRATIAQVLFILNLFGLGGLLLGSSYNEQLDAFTWPTLWSNLKQPGVAQIIGVLFVTLLTFRYWGVTEFDWTAKEASPTSSERPFLLLTPVNGRELLSRILLLWCSGPSQNCYLAV
jgi:hypothetical protein